MPGSINDPVRLDFFQTIRSVGWRKRASGMLVMEYEVSLGNSHVLPSMILSGYPWAGAHSYNLSDFAPVTASDAQGRLLFDKRAPFHVDQEGDVAARGIAFFNLTNISRIESTQFKFRVDTPGLGGTTSETGINYWVHPSDHSLDYYHAHPFTTGDPLNQPFGVVTIPRVFLTESEASSYAALFISPTMTVSSESFSNDIHHNGQWFFDVHSYKTRTDFPYDDHDVPLWDINAEAASIAGADGDGTEAHPIEARAYEVTVKYKDLAVTVVRKL